jgi:predicted dehydrogenase
MMDGQPPEPLRIGVLGAARIAAVAIVDPAHTTGDRLVAIAARDRRRAEAFAATHGVERVLDTYVDVAADPEVEVVYNPLANGLHGPWNLAAIASGKHVLTEKPSASNAKEAREVRDAATAAGVTLLEGFHYLYHPVTRRLHELLATGELGELRQVEVDLVIPAPADDDPRWSLGLAGGALMDLGCYSLHAHLRDGLPLPIDADDALATMELIDACYRAAGFHPRPRTPRMQPPPGLAAIPPESPPPG